VPSTESSGAIATWITALDDTNWRLLAWTQAANDRRPSDRDWGTYLLDRPIQAAGMWS
jgi:hypothetical protein